MRSLILTLLLAVVLSPPTAGAQSYPPVLGRQAQMEPEDHHLASELARSTDGVELMAGSEARWRDATGRGPGGKLAGVRTQMDVALSATITSLSPTSFPPSLDAAERFPYYATAPPQLR